jgi:predicted component of type VI protein secretion system
MPNNNPTGKGGFADNPQNISGGMWSKDTSISYWYNKLIRLDLQEFEEFEPKTMAQQLAHNAIIDSKKELNYLKEVTDRTEGKASQSTDITTNGKEINNIAIPITPQQAKQVLDDLDKEI